MFSPSSTLVQPLRYCHVASFSKALSLDSALVLVWE
ncbi:unnamed protein product [Rhodiola kirilowii]